MRGWRCGELWRLAGIVALAMTCVACHRSADRADLIFINGAEPETLDPAIITGQPEGRIVNALFEGLTTFDASGRPGPGMAESWTVSDDGKVYVFTLRPNARWTNGRPVTAQDFVRSWQRMLSPSTAASYRSQLFFVKNARAFAEGTLSDFSQVGVSAPDDRTLRVELENPTPFFLDLCATPPLAPVPIEVVEELGDGWVKPGRMVNNGAYVLDEWRLNDRIRLRKNPEYWNAESVQLETIEALPIHLAPVAYNFYASGMADLIIDKTLTPNALIDDLRERPDFHTGPFLGVYFLRFNCARPPFDDPRVRRAFAMAIDKERIVRKITRAGEAPAGGLVPPLLPGYLPPDALAFDPSAARELLAAAGYPNGAGFPLTTYLYNESDQNSAIAVELQDMWREYLGISTIVLARQEWKVYLNSLDSLDFGIARSSWVGDYPDANTFLDLFIAGNDNNRTGWTDPAYDQLIDEAAREPDVARRAKIFREAETLLVKDAAPICPLYFWVGIQLYDPNKLGGIEPNPLDEHPLKAMYRKDRGK